MPHASMCTWGRRIIGSHSGWVDRHTDEGSGSGEALFVRIHHLWWNWDANRISRTRVQNTGVSARRIVIEITISISPIQRCRNAIIVQTPEFGELEHCRRRPPTWL